MNEREALKQLLEALDKELPHNMKHIAAGQRFNARTALAQPEYQSTADKSQLERVPAKGTLLAQPEQEPVAWTDGPHLVMRTDWRDRANYKGPWVDIGRAIPDSWVPVLYTTPPQRKPLTDEELEKMWRDGPYDHGTLYDFKLAARATEAAHGIKGDA